MLKCRVGALATSVIIGFGCGGPAANRPPPDAPVRALGTSHVAPPGTMPPDTRPPANVPPPLALQTFSAIVADLERHPGTLEHAGVIAALRQLAEAVAVVAPIQTAELAAIRRGADELERSDPRSLEHADLVRSSLDAAVRGLASTRPRYPDHALRYAEALRALQRAVEAVHPEAPLLSQHGAVVAALQSAGTAIAVGSGVVPATAVGAR
ncbi:MAG: hypothetical protein M3680_16310 [Myxococcota bacterium]|nr:hypothetical protein [Myxococcota bacterium]